MMQNPCKPAAAPLEVRRGSPVAAGLGDFQSANFMGNGEPSLDEMLSDDVVRRVMACDGVGTDQLLSLLDAARNRLR